VETRNRLRRQLRFTDVGADMTTAVDAAAQRVLLEFTEAGSLMAKAANATAQIALLGLNATTATNGASLIGVYDEAANFDGATVEAVLSEIGTMHLAGIQANNNTTLQNLNSVTGWTKMTNFDTNLHDVGSRATADVANDKITLGIGTWEVEASIDSMIGQSSRLYDYAIYKAGSITAYEGRTKSDANGYMNVGIRGYITVASGTEDIDFRMKAFYTGNVILQRAHLCARLVRTY
jgi:hypothetical protein